MVGEQPGAGLTTTNFAYLSAAKRLIAPHLGGALSPTRVRTRIDGNQSAAFPSPGRAVVRATAWCDDLLNPLMPGARSRRTEAGSVASSLVSSAASAPASRRPAGGHEPNARRMPQRARQRRAASISCGREPAATGTDPGPRALLSDPGPLALWVFFRIRPTRRAASLARRIHRAAALHPVGFPDRDAATGAVRRPSAAS